MSNASAQSQLNFASPQTPWAPLMLPGASTIEVDVLHAGQVDVHGLGREPGVNVRDW